MISFQLQKNKAFFSSVIAVCLLFSAGCTWISGTIEGNEYMTPIHQSTFNAFKIGPAIDSKLQAVNAAQHAIKTSRLDWVGQPTPILVEKTIFSEAEQLVKDPNSISNNDQGRLNTSVWLVIFEGEWTLSPPMGTVSPPSNGCAYAIVNATDGMDIQVGSYSCQLFNPSETP